MCSIEDAHRYDKVGTLPFHLLVFGQQCRVFLMVHSGEKYNDAVNIYSGYDRNENSVVVQD